MSFEEHVRRALDSLPPEFARGLRNVAVVIEDEHDSTHHERGDRDRLERRRSHS